jgi:hypothetical protein
MDLNDYSQESFALQLQKLEKFTSLRDFHQQVASYQAWYNSIRTNMNKEIKARANWSPRQSPYPHAAYQMAPGYVRLAEAGLYGETRIVTTGAQSIITSL